MARNLTLPDGQIKSFAHDATGAELAASIGAGLAKAAIAVKVDGELRDLHRAITTDSKIEIITRKSADALELIRHDCAHVMAEAVQELFPGTQVTIGPAIENGFYYDFYRAQPFSTDDLAAIEAKMRAIVARDAKLAREEWPRDTAIAYFKAKGEKFKAELIRDLPPSETITVYRQGEWLDLCRGPHLPSIGFVGTAFKLMKVAGAYWRGDHRNPMLHRIYGTAWRDDKELQDHLTQLEEAEKRDHRKLGTALGLFHFQDEAQGSVFWHPHGYTIYRALENYIRRRLDKSGYIEVKTPQLIDNKLWEASGHWGKYRENMFVVPDEVPSSEEDKPVLSGKARLMALKPMNCPAHVQIFNQGIRSYRDLPIRMAEFGCCHRNEAHGALHGLMRVRQFTQDDAHIFCRDDQVFSEAKVFLKLFFDCYKDLGFDAIDLKVATRPEQRAGSDAQWDLAEKALEDALKEMNIPYTIVAGDGAFYGPKYEFHIRDAIGRSWTCGTFQLDYVLPERLGAAYIGEDGQKHRPVMLHRAILGSMERFIGILIENYAGKLPLWLAPVQATVCTITNDAEGYAQQVVEELQAAGLRATLDIRSEKINAKIREHSMQKVPLILVVGAKEAESRSVALRRLDGEQQQILSLDEATRLLSTEALPPDLKR